MNEKEPRSLSYLALKRALKVGEIISDELETAEKKGIKEKKKLDREFQKAMQKEQRNNHKMMRNQRKF